MAMQSIKRNTRIAAVLNTRWLVQLGKGRAFFMKYFIDPGYGIYVQWDGGTDSNCFLQ
jgi:hypothetical protein